MEKNDLTIKAEALTMSVQEAAKALGISTRNIYLLAYQKDFPAFRLGRRILVSRKGLEEWVRGKEKELLLYRGGIESELGNPDH